MALAKPRKKKPRGKLDPEERKRRKIRDDHIRSVRSVFRNLGFDRVNELTGKDFEIRGQKGELDDAFIYENIILLFEYTIHNSSNVDNHLRKKKFIFSKILENVGNFIEYFRNRSDSFKQRIGDRFHLDSYIIRIIYCSLNEVGASARLNVKEPVYLDYHHLKYFEKISHIIKMSALNEMLEFLKIDPKRVAKYGKISSNSQVQMYDGSILPESSSGLPSGYKVVSFYADAGALLNRAYVLRRDGGWRASPQAYQRMLIGAKIEKIRQKLKTDKRVFVNNIIAILSEDVFLINENGETVDIKKITDTKIVKIQLPNRPNSISLIDGQHRLYSYYESKIDDNEISRLRHQQNLLVTGIIYPKNIDPMEKQRFEAELFLSINSNQTNAQTPLRQAIEVDLKPFSQTAIARRIMGCLAETGPLAGYVEKHFYDKGKMKTSSIVSFGLGPLVKLNGDDSIFRIFDHPEKIDLAEEKSKDTLDAYIRFSTEKINIILSAVKSNVDKARWTPDRSCRNRLLTVTYINSFLITLRFLIRDGQQINFENLKISLNGINEFSFNEYHSSQYNRMAEDIYKKYFKTKESI